LERAAELASKGGGMPTIVNNKVVVRSMMENGASLEDARNAVIAGCQEFLVQGAENARTTASWFSLPKCLELTLNRGRSMLSGKFLGIDTGNPYEACSYEEFEKMFRDQVDYFIEKVVESANRCDVLLAEKRPVPFISTIMNDCIEKGRDFRKDGARYNYSGFLCHGVANTADSLAVIKKLVFEERETTMPELVEALKDNWEGHEKLLDKVRSVPKYGNDNDYVDTIAVRIAERISNTVPRFKNNYGGKFRPGFSTPSTHVLYGRKCAATPDGRKHKDNFAYGFGPMEGCSLEGPTAVINSCTKFPHWKAYHGLAFNLSFPPSAVKGEEGIKRLESIVKVYLKKGGRYVHFNIQDVETLKRAQKEPEKYKDLIVRVHGMSAYFVNLDPLIQEDIIKRIECGL
jgi:formate C-acetyltransferase